jgi:hypothetical protein
LVSLPRESLEAVLTKRGIDPRSLPETLAVLAENATPFTAVDVINDTFTPKPHYPTPFPIGRYGDGHAPVYYSALEEGTCVEEVKYHLKEALQPGRHFAVVSCQFEGAVLLLCGHENTYPYLTSQTESGYPNCQRLANSARSKVEALHAPSARQRLGTCVPVFTQLSLANPQVIRQGRFDQRLEGGLLFVHVKR